LSKNSISIFTPFYNPGRFFETCLNSIINQTFKDWELILIDDFSTDESYVLAEKFAASDPRIKLIKNKEKGLINSLQLAYKYATGAMITRMDADDIMPIDKLDILHSNIVAKGEGHVAIGCVKYFSESQLGEGYQFYENWINSLTELGTSFDEIYRECVIPSPNFLIFKSDFDKIGGFSANRYPEDYDLAFRMYQNGLKVIPTDKVTHLWRDHPTRSTRTQEHYQMLNFIPLKVKYFTEIDYDDSKELVLWGAAKKGKLIARELIKLNIPFIWACENVQRFGHNVYGNIIRNASEIANWSNKQVIIAVSNKSDQIDICERLSQQECPKKTGYFLFF
jgi:glycosyltransferase involved in cell wall biosynthesis